MISLCSTGPAAAAAAHLPPRLEPIREEGGEPNRAYRRLFFRSLSPSLFAPTRRALPWPPGWRRERGMERKEGKSGRISEIWQEIIEPPREASCGILATCGRSWVWARPPPTAQPCVARVARTTTGGSFDPSYCNAAFSLSCGADVARQEHPSQLRIQSNLGLTRRRRRWPMTLCGAKRNDELPIACTHTHTSNGQLPNWS